MPSTPVDTTRVDHQVNPVDVDAHGVYVNGDRGVLFKPGSNNTGDIPDVEDLELAAAEQTSSECGYMVQSLSLQDIPAQAAVPAGAGWHVEIILILYKNGIFPYFPERCHFLHHLIF